MAWNGLRSGKRPLNFAQSGKCRRRLGVYSQVIKAEGLDTLAQRVCSLSSSIAVPNILPLLLLTEASQLPPLIRMELSSSVDEISAAQSIIVHDFIDYK